MSGRELSARKKLEIIYLYFRGLGYDEIARRTGTSKGSVHNVVNELLEGRFPAVARAEEVSLLRDLAVSLKKAGLNVYEAMVGLGSYERLRELGMEPAQLKDLIKVLLDLKPDDVSTRAFVVAALRLHSLGEKTGRDYEDLAAEADELAAKLPTLRREADFLRAQRGKLEKLERDEKGKLEQLKKERGDLDGLLRTLREHLNEVERGQATAQRAVDALEKHVSDLESHKSSLGSEIKSMKVTVKGLDRIGLGAKELRRLLAALDNVGARTGIDRGRLLERLLQGVKELEGVIYLEREKKRVEAEVGGLSQNLGALEAHKEKIRGEIAALESDRAQLEGLVNSIRERVTEDIQATLEVAFAKAQQASQKVTEIAEQAEAPIRQVAERVRVLNDELGALEQDTSRYEGLAKLHRFLEDPLDLSWEESKPLVVSLVKKLSIWADGRLSPITSLLISNLVSTICHELERSRL